VFQLVNTPDIYEENNYQRRNLLLYHCLLESGLPKFNVSEQLQIERTRFIKLKKRTLNIVPFLGVMEKLNMFADLTIDLNYILKL
jgi:hypothetical protein